MSLVGHPTLNLSIYVQRAPEWLRVWQLGSKLQSALWTSVPHLQRGHDDSTDVIEWF